MDMTPPVEFAAWVACATFAVALFNQGSKALFTLRGKPSPLEQAAATSNISERVSRIEQCIGACKAEQDHRLSALEDSQAELRRHISLEVDKIFSRINAVATLSATANGELGIIKAQLNMLLTMRGSKHVG